ncbi:MAG: host specificity protein J [Burkholderiaceae bacterium]|nr:host specificity protein J [Burkholderiaceae bacterium]
MSHSHALTLAPPRGAKKGGGRSPQEASDTLRSTQIVDVVMLVSEGEAQGLVNGLKSVYLDKVPIENADSSRNFESVQFAYVTGTQGQAAMSGLDAVQNEVAVGLQVDFATPVVRTISDATVDHVRVTIGVPQLTLQDDVTGDLNGSSFEFAVEIQSNGGGYVERHREVVAGKTTSLYSKAVKIQLTGAPPWDVRVRRTVADPVSAREQNRFSWQSYTEISSIKLRYPNSAVAWLRVNAANFGRIPTVAFDWLGQVVDIPANYDPITRAYSGAWNGTFKPGWTSTPPWVVYDVATHDRYGLGQFVPKALQDKWTLYAIAQYCDQLVPDGRGGMEPRFTCNLNLEVQAEAYQVLQDLCAIFRGMCFWSAGGVTYAQDAPSDPVHLFTPANVHEGVFTYSDTSEKTQHSMFVCWWNDIGLFGQAVPEIYVDEALVARYGLRTLELRPLGIASRGQAARACRWARHSEQMEGEVVSFEVGSDGVAVAPGKVFRVADPNEQGERLGGRVRAATETTVTLDAPVTLAAGESYTINVLQPDPVAAHKLLTEARAVTTPAGETSVITVSAPFSAVPVAQTVWVLESDAIAATTWRCLKVEEVKGANRYRITGMAHNPSKYDAIELGLTLDQRPVSRLGLVPPRPLTLASTETVYRTGQLYRSRVTLSWPEPARGLLYLVSWRLNGGGWTEMPAASANSVDIDGLAAGNLDVQVRSQNALGNTSPPLAALIVVGGAGQLAALGNNLMDATWWAPGAAIAWGQNVDDAGDANAIVWATGPRGATEALWRATAGTNAEKSGGWTDAPMPGNDLAIEPGKTYRFALPVYRLSGTARVFWGMGGPGGVGSVVDHLNTSGLADNPYFAVGEALQAGRWYLLVGYVFPTGQTGLSHTGAGVYDMANGALVAAGLNFNWHAGVTRAATRAYQYYASVGAQLLFGKPAVHLVDGSEPGLNELLGAGAILNSQQQWTDVQDRPLLYRALARGYSAGSSTPAEAGLYDEAGNLISGAARSYVVNVFDRSTKLPAFTVSFDVYAGGGAAASMAALLNALQPDRIVLVRSYDEPMSYRLTAGLDAAMYRCGASRAVYGSPQFMARSAYVLVGIPGCGEGQGYEAYQGEFGDDPNAWCDVAFGIAAQGKLVVTGSSATPKTLADYSYVGDLAATRDIRLVASGGMSVSGNRVKKKPGTGSAWNEQVYSRDAYAGGVYVSALVPADAANPGGAVMFGLNQDPTLDASYASIDYALYIDSGVIRVYESGADRGSFGAYVPGLDVLVVGYDGYKVRYLRNGTVLRELAAPANLRLSFDSSFYSEGVELEAIRVGPLSAVAGIDVPQLTPEARLPVRSVRGSTGVTVTARDHIPYNYGDEVVAEGAPWIAAFNGKALVSFQGVATVDTASQYDFAIQNKQGALDGWNAIFFNTPGAAIVPMNSTVTFELVAGNSYQFGVGCHRLGLTESYVVTQQQLTVEIRYGA